MLGLCLRSKVILPYKKDIVRSLLNAAFLALCCRMKQIVGQEGLSVKPVADSLFQRFLHQLSSSEVKHRPVESFANELCVSPKYLSVVCKKNSGKTANEWITEYVMEDIRYYLKQTDLGAKQICDILGFPNPSFFGKYVKEHFGLTPMQMRNNAKAQ